MEQITKRQEFYVVYDSLASYKNCRAINTKRAILNKHIIQSPLNYTGAKFLKF